MRTDFGKKLMISICTSCVLDAWRITKWIARFSKHLLILISRKYWAKASLRTKLMEVMEFQLSCFKSLKMTLWKCCTQYASLFGKLSSGHRTGKCLFSFQSLRKSMPKKAQTTAQVHFIEWVFNIYWMKLSVSRHGWIFCNPKVPT